MGRLSILFIAFGLLAAPARAQDCVEDADGDGYVSAAACPDNGTDCDDSDAEVHPFATETPNDGVDQDCNGEDYVALCDSDQDGFDSIGCGGADCNDRNDEIFPGAREFDGDGIDQDCNGLDDCPPIEWVQGGLGCASAPRSPGGAPWPLGLALAGLCALSLHRRARG